MYACIHGSSYCKCYMHDKYIKYMACHLKSNDKKQLVSKGNNIFSCSFYNIQYIQYLCSLLLVSSVMRQGQGYW